MELLKKVSEKALFEQPNLESQTHPTGFEQNKDENVILNAEFMTRY
jgi:hypothetical protein